MTIIIPPNNVALERAVLGACFHSAVAARALGDVPPECFTLDKHHVLHRVLGRVVPCLNGRPPDPALVHAAAVVAGEPLDAVFLAELHEAGLLVVDVAPYLVVLRELAAQREECAVAAMVSAAQASGQTDGPNPALWRAVQERLTRAQILREQTAPSETAAGVPWAWATSFRGQAIMHAAVEHTPFVIEDLFSRGHQHAIIGASGSAKSWVAAGLAVAVALPEVTTFLGQPVRAHGPAVLESWEQGVDEDLRRVQKLVRGHGLREIPDTLILQSMPFLPLQDEGAYQARLRDFREAQVLLYVFDSLSEGAGIDLNDNTAYTAWWRARVRPLLDLNITVVCTHLRGHFKPGTSGDRDAAFRGATQIRALCMAALECRHLTARTSLLIHNKYRDTQQLPLGILTLTGEQHDPTVTLELAGIPDSGSKADLARQQLLALARLHPLGFDRKRIEATLNDKAKPKAKRISKKTYDPGLAALVADKTFETFTRGNSDMWRLLRDPDAPDEDEDD